MVGFGAGCSDKEVIQKVINHKEELDRGVIIVNNDTYPLGNHLPIKKVEKLPPLLPPLPKSIWFPKENRRTRRKNSRKHNKKKEHCTRSKETASPLKNSHL